MVVDQSSEDYIYLNIPRMPDIDNIELTEEELAQVAGGTTWGCAIGGGIAAKYICDFIDGYMEN